jgi:type IV pilus assembly protein PilP
MSQARTRTILTAAGLAGLLMVTGCSDGLDELRLEIEQAKQKPGGRIKPLPEVRPYVSHEYQMADRRSPFLQSLAGESPSGPRPDVQRPREYLEQFPLDTLKMVGTLGSARTRPGADRTGSHRVLPAITSARTMAA